MLSIYYKCATPQNIASVDLHVYIQTAGQYTSNMIEYLFIVFNVLNGWIIIFKKSIAPRLWLLSFHFLNNNFVL